MTHADRILFEPVDTPEGLAATSPPCVYRGHSFAYWRLDEELVGTIFWGIPTGADIETLLRCWSVKIHRRHAPHASMFDTRRVVAVDLDAFARIEAFVAEHHDELARRITRQALICAPGIQGSTVAGFARLYRLRYAVEVFESLGAALGWCGREAEEIEPALDALADEVSSVAPEVARLRAWLGNPAVLADATLSHAARALGTSERTLQRRLTAAGTSFIAELTAARIAAARTMLQQSSHKVVSIARRVGFASEQHFGHTFRRWVGETPAQYRARGRP